MLNAVRPAPVQLPIRGIFRDDLCGNFFVESE
jgi:hypothetical protein